MKELIKLGIVFLLGTILVLILWGCGPAYYLNHSKKDITKAIAKGADIKSDTTYAKRTFKFEGAKSGVEVSPFILKQDGTRVILKDTVFLTKEKIKLQFRDNFIEVECPPDTVTVEVPVKVEQEIKAGYTKWYVIKTVAGFSLFFLVLGFLVSKIIKI